MSISMQCLDCKHYTGLCTCDAFPDGIPQEIFDGRVIHNKAYEGDGGIMYDPIDDNETEINMMENTQIRNVYGRLIEINKIIPEPGEWTIEV